MKVFIGSSYEQRRLVEWITDFIQEEYADELEPVPWTAPWPGGRYTLEHLKDIVETTDAAILFWTADDKTWYRGSKRVEPRDNLIFEAGLFFATHGPERAQLLLPKYRKTDGRSVAIPSDLSGLTVNYFRWSDNDVEATGLPNTARKVCNNLRRLGARERLPSKLEFLRNHHAVEEVSTLVGDFRTMLNEGIGHLARSANAKEVDILVAYRIGDIRRDLVKFRDRSGAKLRACLANMWDNELLAVFQRKYSDRTDEHVRDAVCDSIRGLLGSGEPRFTKRGLSRFIKLKKKPKAKYDIRLTDQRITYSYYRVDDVAFVIPLDMKLSQDPAPMAWAIAKETAPRTYEQYVREFGQMFQEARNVYKS